MNAPKVLTVAETHAGGRHLATVTVQVPIEDAGELLGHCDLEDAQGAGLDQTLDASKRAYDRRELERKAERAERQARDDADAATAAAAALEQGALLASNAAGELAPPIAPTATSTPEEPSEEPAAPKPPAPTGETLLGLAVAKDPMH